MRVLAVLLLGACGIPEVPPTPPKRTATPPTVPTAVPIDALDHATLAAIEPLPPPPPSTVPGAELWLRGSTHVHAQPSGDSATPIPDVIRWYETRGFDFIVLSDHNRISEVGETSTAGQVAVRTPPSGLIVLAGIELTHNPTGCLPAGDDTDRCRIHVNLVGPTARPAGKLEWANRRSDLRVDKYQAALDQQKLLGGLAQLNHPQWHWGMTPEVLIELARRGFSLIEIANAQFTKWDTGDAEHPSTGQLWDAALAQGAQLWGVASDDAHHYDGAGTYPAGGGWVVVKARREPQAILDALAAGRFYASNGVVLELAEVFGDVFTIEVARTDPGTHVIEWIENGKTVQTVTGKAARRALPRGGYLRGVITRGDGKQAWVQPARRR
ncbi:MAG: PHP domain-containing protein [Deltaproteobacteria bacterium]|nr:PHP domain-containing protein [Deltaproteobacteria bacterium]